MSSCIVFQQNQKCYLASDCAVSINVDGKNIRIKDDYRKSFIFKDSLIFCSGKIDVVEDIVHSIKLLEEINLDYIKEICNNNFRGKSKLELFIVKYENEITSYQLSSYNDFEITKRIVKPSDTEILSLGFNTVENCEIAYQHIDKCGNVKDLFMSIYNDIACEEIGGLIDIFEISSNGVVNLYSENLNDKYCIKNKLNRNAHLLVADTIVGKLIAGQNLSIGNANNTMTIDENGIQIEGNLFKVKGTDGTSKDFNSYLEVLNNSITAGVSDAKNHTDAQVKVLSDSINTKVSKGQDFQTEFNQTANGFDFVIGNDGTNIKMDKNGITIKDGGLKVTNQYGEVIIDGSSNMFKIKAVLEITLDADTQLDYQHRLKHNMSYIPAYFGFQVGTVSTMGSYTNTLLPAVSLQRNSNNQTLEFSTMIRINADEQDIIINYQRANVDIEKRFRIKLFVLQEALI